MTDRQRTTASSPWLSLVLAATMASLVFGAGCTGQQPEDETRLGVVVTIPPVADFVEQVGRELVDVTLMVPAGASPHTYEPTPGQMVEVSNADVYVKVGSGVEFELVWLDNLTAQNPDMPIVDCSKGVAKSGNDPHIWNSPQNAIVMVSNIMNGLSSADPANSEIYERNGADYVAQLSDLHEYIADRFADAASRHFMIYHPSFGYFAQEYGLVQLAIEHQGKSPTPQVLQACIDLATEHSLQYVFVAPQFATADAESVADAIDGDTAFIDPLASSYVPNMRSVAAAIDLELE